MNEPLSDVHRLRRTTAVLVTALLLAGYAILVVVVAMLSLASGTATATVTGAGLAGLAVVLFGAVAVLGASAGRARRGMRVDELGRLGVAVYGFAIATWGVAAVALFLRAMPAAPESAGQLLLVTMASLVPAGLLTGVGRNLRSPEA